LCTFLVLYIFLAPLSVYSQETTIEALERQLQEEPKNIEVLLNISVKYRIDKRYADALAKEIDPNSWAVRSEIALNYYINTQYEKSLEEGKIANQLTPNEVLHE
jgi:hypothetical protein